jgi:predicted AAA+ superfamily ATPase
MEDIYYAFNPWWEGKGFDSGIPRLEYLNEIEKPFKRRQIDIIIGSRRVGKTTFLKQLVKRCIDKDIQPKNILYLALDNPRFTKTAISEHLKQFRKIFMHSRSEKLYLFFDEVQESKNWESELKAIYDLENVKIVCTGSTSSLLKKQGGRLTGRQIVTKIYPLTFKEYISFKKNMPGKSEDYKYEKLFEEYLEIGGYPENALEPSEDYMNNLIEDIIARDIMRLHRINRADILKDMLIILAGSIGSRTSFNKISKVLGITVDTVKEYMQYLEEAFLIKPLEKWSPSHLDKVYSQRKVYFYDTGIKTVLTGKGDISAKAENIVFLHLARAKATIGYYAESERELDFACGSFKSPMAIEVKYDSKFDWQDKRFKGVKLFIKHYPGAKCVTIISKNIEEEIKDSKLKISVIPAWKYLLT